MAIKIKYCKKCGKITSHMVSNTNHILHLLLSVITAGVWVPLWALLWLNNMTKTKYCMACMGGHQR